MDYPTGKAFELLTLIEIRGLSGREVAKRYREATGHAISYGTLYTTFRRLKDAGWVATHEDHDVDGRIRYFRITGAGARALAVARVEHARLAQFGLPRLGVAGA